MPGGLSTWPLRKACSDAPYPRRSSLRHTSTRLEPSPTLGPPSLSIMVLLVPPATTEMILWYLGWLSPQLDTVGFLFTQCLVQFRVLSVPDLLAYLRLSVFLTILKVPRCLPCLHLSTCIRHEIILKYHLLQKFSTEFCTPCNTKIKNTNSKPFIC